MREWNEQRRRIPFSARRCTTHGIHYPAEYDFRDCPVCKFAGEEDPQTSYISNAEPDDDWDKQAKQLICDLKLASEERDLIPTVKGDVKVRDGQLWVSAWDVFPGAQRRLGEADLFRIGQQVFEVLHYQHPTREYLVRAFSMTLSDEDLERLAGG